MKSRPMPDHETLVPGNPPPDTPPDDDNAADGELRIVVRKLKLPVRPRGVLAE